MRSLFLLVLTFCAAGFAQDDLTFTAQMANGRIWNAMPNDAKVGYMSGIHDAIVWKTLNSNSRPSEDNIGWAVGFVTGDYISELDSFYKDLSNIRIPLPMAVDFCTKKLKGQLKKAELEGELIQLRTFVSHLK